MVKLQLASLVYIDKVLDIHRGNLKDNKCLCLPSNMEDVVNHTHVPSEVNSLIGAMGTYNSRAGFIALLTSDKVAYNAQCAEKTPKGADGQVFHVNVG